MRKISFITLFFLSAIQLISQCNYEINRVDPFTEKNEQLTEAIVIARKVKRNNALPLRKVLAQLKNFGGEMKFILKFPLTAVMSPTFYDRDQESHLMILLENGTKVKLKVAQLMGNQEEGIEFRYAIDFILKAADIRMLKQSSIKALRVAMKSNSFDVNVESDAARVLKNSLDCI